MPVGIINSRVNRLDSKSFVVLHHLFKRENGFLATHEGRQSYEGTHHVSRSWDGYEVNGSLVCDSGLV
jgi:hypothetical protein